MKKIKIGFLAALQVITCCSSFGQLRDGVLATPSFVELIKSNYADEKAFAFSLTVPKTPSNVYLRVYVINNDKGKTEVRETDIANSMSTLNDYFNVTGIRFALDTIEYVNDYHYAYIAYNYNRSELLAKHSVLGMVNLYLADSINMGNGNVYGFTYFPNDADSNYIFLSKEYVNGISLATLIGHYLGLLSTHETLGGNELADESNCAESGDFICDTYADPGLFGQVSDACEYTGSARDDHGEYYVPSVANIMSDSPQSCKCGFTPLQYRRMYYYFLHFRQSVSKP
jgi:hypothetical protein